MFRYVWSVLERSTDRGLYVWLVVAPTELDRQVLPLPRGLGVLHWMLRPIRLARYYGKANS
jgi:hypothetical protein